MLRFYSVILSLVDLALFGWQLAPQMPWRRVSEPAQFVLHEIARRRREGATPHHVADSLVGDAKQLCDSALATKNHGDLCKRVERVLFHAFKIQRKM